MKVLVVDDSRSDRMLIRRVLGDKGHVVIEAEHGQEALELLAEDNKVDLALVDWNMPIMDGLTFVQSIRRAGHSESLRIIMTTTEVELSQVQRALEAGADEYLMKPFGAEELIARIAMLPGAESA